MRYLSNPAMNRWNPNRSLHKLLTGFVFIWWLVIAAISITGLVILGTLLLNIHLIRGL